MAVGYSKDGGRTVCDLSVMATDPTQQSRFNETDLLRLADGRFLAIVRVGTPPHWSYRCYSEDQGKTWTPYQRVSFKGQCPCLVQLRSGDVLCAYRDMEPNRPGISVSVTDDAGKTWRWVGQVYSGANWDCGYPVMIPLPDGRIFCVYYTAFVDGDCRIQGMWLEETG